MSSGMGYNRTDSSGVEGRQTENGEKTLTGTGPFAVTGT